MISLTPAEVGGQSPSQADWSPPEGSNKLARLESLLLGCMTAKIHKYARGDSIDTLKPDVEPRYQAKFYQLCCPNNHTYSKTHIEGFVKILAKIIFSEVL